MSNKRNRFSLEVRARAVRMVLENEGDYSSRWAALMLPRINGGCTETDPDFGYGLLTESIENKSFRGLIIYVLRVE